jgi:uncharacterized membrane protein HdeD (DUF308 family)
MKNNHKNFLDRELNKLFWLFLLQGLCLIGVGVLIIYRPVILLGLVVTGFLLLGLASIVTGARIKRFSNKLNKIISFEIRGGEDKGE